MTKSKSKPYKKYLIYIAIAAMIIFVAYSLITEHNKPETKQPTVAEVPY